MVHPANVRYEASYGPKLERFIPQSNFSKHA